MLRFSSFAILALALFLTSDAGAIGSVVGSQSEQVTMSQARFAIAVSPAQTTRWASIRIEAFPGAMAWLLPIRRGARVDEVSDAWFEALELATAPRIVPRMCESAAPLAAKRALDSPDRVPTERSLQTTEIDDLPALRSFAAAGALELPPEVESRFAALQARGFLLAALLYAGPAGGGFTRTVRITDDSFPVVPLFMTLGAVTPVRVTAFLMGPGRARLGDGPEIEIGPAGLVVAPDGTTNYEKTRTEQLLAANGQSWIVEASERDLFLTGARRPGGVEVTPPIAPTFDQRVAAYGDPPTDLTLALYGLDPAKVWVTRVAGIVPVDHFGDDVAVTVTASASKSPFLFTTQVPANCPRPVTMPPDPGLVAPPPVGANPRPTGPDPYPPPDLGPVVVETAVVDSQPAQVNVSGSCDGSPSSQPQQTSSSSSDGCGSSSDQSSDQTDDGCASSGPDSSQDQSGGGCDGGSQDDGQSSSGCDSSSDSSTSSTSSDSKCAMSRRPRRGRSRTSLVAWGGCAFLLPLRRAMRRGRAAR